MKRPAIGEPAPPIDLPMHDHDARAQHHVRHWSLEAHRGRTVVVIFHRHIH